MIKELSELFYQIQESPTSQTNRTRLEQVFFIQGNNFYLGMSEPRGEELLIREPSAEHHHLIEMAELKDQIRRSRLALMSHLKGVPDRVGQKMPQHSVSVNTEQKSIAEERHTNELVEPVAAKTPELSVLAGVVQQAYGMQRNVLLSGRKQIEDVFYGDIYHPRSISYEEGPGQRQEIVSKRQVKRGRDIWQHRSEVIARVNCHSLTPTKLTFSYQSKPSSTVFYAEKRSKSLNQAQQEGHHPRESFIQQVIERQSKEQKEDIMGSVIESQVEPLVPRGVMVSTAGNMERSGGMELSKDMAWSGNMEKSGDMERREVHRSGCRIEVSGNKCRLCELTRSHIKRTSQIDHNKMTISLPQEAHDVASIQPVQEDTISFQNQQLIKTINESPSKLTQPYLAYYGKYQYTKAQPSQPGPIIQRKKHDHLMMKAMESNHVKMTNSQLPKQQQYEQHHHTPEKRPQIVGSSRMKESERTIRKIFHEGVGGNGDSSYIRVEGEEKRPGYLSKAARQINYGRNGLGDKNYQQIQARNSSSREHSPHIHPHLVGSRAPAFQYQIVTPTLIFTPIIKTPTFNPNQQTPLQTYPFPQRFSPCPVYKERLSSPSNYQHAVHQQMDGRNSLTMAFTPSGREASRVHEHQWQAMSPPVRCWYQSNLRDIDRQSQIIHSYVLIKRYMSQAQVSARIYKLITGMVQPKRWLLLMVDEVYGKLKDRYLPLHG